ncbi:MAG: NADH-quinone oxidoreductase subunit I [Deltaproteobacteria bacterium]|nr:NADH-quinone oxidoreductase subunit I [Deltaproteobacteria bacterium]
MMELIKKILFIDFIKGLTLTLAYNVSRSVTHRYPDEEKWIPYKRFRGMHTLNKNEKGQELCVACELCVKACPTRCITVVPMEDNSGRGIADRVPAVWKVDLVRCLFCGYCEDACPTTAVRMGREFELACFDRDTAVKHIDDLLKEQSIPQHFEGGVLVKAKLVKEKDGTIKVKAGDLWKQSDWWNKV